MSHSDERPIVSGRSPAYSMEWVFWPSSILSSMVVSWSPQRQEPEPSAAPAGGAGDSERHWLSCLDKLTGKLEGHLTRRVLRVSSPRNIAQGNISVLAFPSHRLE